MQNCFPPFLLEVETMENSNRVIKDYIADILEQVSSLMEKWEPYEKTRKTYGKCWRAAVSIEGLRRKSRPC